MQLRIIRLTERKNTTAARQRNAFLNTTSHDAYGHPIQTLIVVF